MGLIRFESPNRKPGGVLQVAVSISHHLYLYLQEICQSFRGYPANIRKTPESKALIRAYENPIAIIKRPPFSALSEIVCPQHKIEWLLAPEITKTFIRPSSVAIIWMAMALKMMMSAVVLMTQAKGHESGQEPPSHAGCFVTNGTTMLTVPFLQEALVRLGFDFGWISNSFMEGCVGKNIPQRRRRTVCLWPLPHLCYANRQKMQSYFKVTN